MFFCCCHSIFTFSLNVSQLEIVEFVKAFLHHSRPLPNKTKLKFDQDFTNYSIYWVCCAFGNVYFISYLLQRISNVFSDLAEAASKRATKTEIEMSQNPFPLVEGATGGKLGIPSRSTGEEVRAFQLKTCLGQKLYCPPDQDQLYQQIPVLNVKVVKGQPTIN